MSKNLNWTSKSNQILEVATNLKHYNTWLYSQFKFHFGRHVLEIGSGLGGITDLLPQRNLTLSDLQTSYIKNLKTRYPNQEIIKLDIEKDSVVKLTNKFDTIFSSNVFEHIKNDQQAINNCHKLLKKGGKLLLFVPASPSIYGQLDHDMGHYRRYTLNELKNKTQKAGFQIIVLKYANFIGYFTWVGRGKLLSRFFKLKNKNNTTADSLFSKIFDYFVVPFLYLESYFPIPFGQSLVLVAKKI